MMTAKAIAHFIAGLLVDILALSGLLLIVGGWIGILSAYWVRWLFLWGAGMCGCGLICLLLSIAAEYVRFVQFVERRAGP